MSYNESLNPNSNFPRMSQSEWDSAPFNEPAPPKERKFKCNVSVTLERTVSVPTQAYNEYVEQDEDGKRLEIDTENVVWEDEYNGNCITVKDMLNKLKNYVERDLSVTAHNSDKGRHLQQLLEACQGWDVTETYVEEV